MSPRTKKNLNSAMEAAALAFAKYTRFAARARMDEDWDLARELQQTAETERLEHFASEADLEGLIESSPNNLRNTIATEKKEIEMYKQFARDAQQDGDLSAAAVFERVVRDKVRRCARFQHITENMGLHSDVELVAT